MELLQTFGAIGGLGVIGLAIRIGISWGEVSRAVSRTDKAVNDPEIGLVSRVQRVEQTIHGAQGDNGMYSDVKDLKRRFDDLPEAPTRRKTDKKRRTA